MNSRGIILEGYSNAGKTSLLRAIKQYQAQDELGESSAIILGEHYSQVLNNVRGQSVRLSREQHLELLGTRVEMLGQLNEWANISNEDMQQACQDLTDTQNRLRTQAAKSAVPTYEINTDLKDWNGYAKTIMKEQILLNP